MSRRVGKALLTTSCLFIGPLGGFWFTAAPVVAQAEEAVIDDVKVTGEDGGLSRREITAQKTPRSIDVVTGKTAENEHLFCLDDFAQKIANYRPNTATPHSSRAAIRGIGIGSGTGVGSQSATGFMIDNVFWIYPGFQWGDFVDLESLEIAHGPQGTAGGKNTTVGSIVMRTQLPSFDRKATFETSFGSYNRTTSKLNVTGPVIDDKLAYRITTYFDRDDGWIRDQLTGAGYGNYDRWGARGQLLYAGDEITDRLIFSYGASHEYNEYTTNGGPIGDSVLVYANGALPTLTFTQALWKRLHRFPLTFDPYKPFLARQGLDPSRTITVSNELNWQIGDNTLTSISAYGYTRNEQRGYQDGNEELQIRYGGMNTNVGQLSQEVRLASPKDQPLEWLGGVYSIYEDASNQMHHTNFGIDAAAWYSNPAAAPGLTDWWYTKARDIQIAAYGQATYHVDERLALTFGLRDSADFREGSVLHTPALVPGFSIAAQQAALIAAGGFGFADTGGQTKSLNALTGIFNPQYNLNDNILVYGLAGRGEKAAAVNTSANPIYVNGVFNSFPAVFTKPDVSWDYEFGFKTKWLDGGLIANVNFYWNDLYNFQTTQNKTVTDSNGSPVSVSYLGNAAHVRLRGVEFDGRWSPIERLWISFSGAYTDARYVSYSDAAPPTDWVWTTPKGSAPSSLSLTNTRFTGIPWLAFNVGATYEHPVGALFEGLGDWANRPLKAISYVNVAWYDKAQLTNPWSVFQVWQPAYALLNAGFGLRTEDGRYSLTFWAKNLFDVRPWTSWSPGSANGPTTVGLTTQPRNYGGTLQVQLF